MAKKFYPLGRSLLLLFLSITWLQAEISPDSLPAFPGAEGFGAVTPGGRGGRVIKVTNLETNGPGSLQEACSAEGPRIVVFEVSGVIPGDVTIEHSRISIMGQTAPGAGITIKGMLVTPYTEDGSITIEDMVLRFLRVRPDPIPGVSWADAIQFSKIRRCVLDHVSCSWSSDETVDWYGARESTIQWCTIEESDTEGHPDGRHNYGLINGPDGEKFTIHHTLFAHHSRRCPAVANGPADVRNLVVYNFRDGFLHDNPPNNLGFNIIGNYYKAGPSEPSIFPFCFEGKTSYYLRDNYIAGVGIVQDPWAEKDKLYGLQYYAQYGVKARKETEVPQVTTHSPLEAYELVLDQAGCFPRDTVSRRTVSEVRSGTGSWGRHDPGDLMAGLKPEAPPVDRDNDGMADSWERANGLNPADSSDYNKVMESGYTAIEEYCNLLATRLVETGGSLPPRRYDFSGDIDFTVADAVALILLSRDEPDNSELDIDTSGRYTVADVIRLLLIMKNYQRRL